jgi:hypothetical protein
VLVRRELRHIVTVAEKLQVMLPRQIRDELLVPIRLRPAQFVIEMNDRKDNSQLAPQLQQQPQQRNRINPTGNGNAGTISGFQEFLPPDMGKHVLCQGMHGNIVP